MTSYDYKRNKLNFRPEGFGGVINIQHGHEVIGRVYSLNAAELICPEFTRKEHIKGVQKKIRDMDFSK